MLYDTPILICCVQERSSLRAREGRGPPQSFQFLIGIYVHVFLLNNIYIYIYDSKLNIRLFFGPVVVLCPCKLNVSRSSLPWCLFCILLVFFLNYYTRRHVTPQTSINKRILIGRKLLGNYLKLKGILRNKS
jgi:hypothetical protein